MTQYKVIFTDGSSVIINIYPYQEISQEKFDEAIADELRAIGKDNATIYDFYVL